MSNKLQWVLSCRLVFVRKKLSRFKGFSIFTDLETLKRILFHAPYRNTSSDILCKERIEKALIQKVHKVKSIKKIDLAINQ